MVPCYHYLLYGSRAYDLHGASRVMFYILDHTTKMIVVALGIFLARGIETSRETWELKTVES